MVRKSVAVLALAASGAALLVAGCGDDEESAEEPAATTTMTMPDGAGSGTAPESTRTAPEPTRTASRPTRVRVVLGKPGEFSLVPTPRRVPAGRVIFTVVNRGSLEHELVILRTTARAADLAPEDIMHGQEKGRVNKHPEHQQPGTTQTIRVTLKPGHYSMICNVAGHYQAGQFADFVVT